MPLAEFTAPVLARLELAAGDATAWPAKRPEQPRRATSGSLVHNASQPPAAIRTTRPTANNRRPNGSDEWVVVRCGLPVRVSLDTGAENPQPHPVEGA